MNSTPIGFTGGFSSSSTDDSSLCRKHFPLSHFLCDQCEGERQEAFVVCTSIRTKEKDEKCCEGCFRSFAGIIRATCTMRFLYEIFLPRLLSHEELAEILPAIPCCAFCRLDDNPVPAFVYCADCDEEMCFPCIARHKESYATHHLTSLPSFSRETSVLPAPSPLVFKDKQGKPLVKGRSPYPVTILTYCGVFFLLEVNTRNIKIFAEDGRVLSNIDLSPYCQAGEGSKGLTFACDIAFTSQGLLLVSFLNKPEVIVLERDGLLRSSFSTRRAGDNAFGVTSICCDSEDNIYFSDSVRAVVLIYVSSYNLVHEMPVTCPKPIEGGLFTPVPEPVVRVRIDREDNLVTCSERNVSVYNKWRCLLTRYSQNDKTIATRFASVTFDDQNRYFVTEKESGYIYMNIGTPKSLNLARLCHADRRPDGILFCNDTLYVVRMEAQVLCYKIPAIF